MTSADVRKAPCAEVLAAAGINSAQRSFADLQAFGGTIWCGSAGQLKIR
jgi:hypothetical protein